MQFDYYRHMTRVPYTSISMEEPIVRGKNGDKLNSRLVCFDA